MRKGRLELWVGLGSVALVLAAALAAHKRNRLHALWLQYRFYRCPRELCKPLLAGMADLDGIPGKLYTSPGDLEIVERTAAQITVRNNRRHRVYVDDPWAHPGREGFSYSYDQILDGPVDPAGHRSYWLPGHILEPGETVKIAVRPWNLSHPEEISDIPLGHASAKP